MRKSRMLASNPPRSRRIACFKGLVHTLGKVNALVPAELYPLPSGLLDADDSYKEGPVWMMFDKKTARALYTSLSSKYRPFIHFIPLLLLSRTYPHNPHFHADFTSTHTQWQDQTNIRYRTEC